jgi:hypothetical protein
VQITFKELNHVNYAASHKDVQIDFKEELRERFFSKLATKPYCSFKKRADKIRIKSIAFKHPYVQTNPPHLCAWLVFDCDHDQLKTFEEAGLPAPNMICIDKKTKFHHIYYAVKDVYTTSKARTKPLNWLAAIQRTYCFHLNADIKYVGLIAKNPFHSDWETIFFHSNVYDLEELSSYKKLIPKPRSVATDLTSADTSLEGYSRHCHLFDMLRWWSYRNINKYEPEPFIDAVLDVALRMNKNLIPPLLFSSVKSTAKSVSKYTERRRDSFEKKYERTIGLNPELDLKTKQSLGAAYSSDIKANKTRFKIIASYKLLVSLGKKPTQSAVSEHSKVSLRTVKYNWKAVKNGI